MYHTDYPLLSWCERDTNQWRLTTGSFSLQQIYKEQYRNYHSAICFLPRSRQRKPSRFLVPVSILYPRPWKCAHILELYFQKKDNRPRPKWNTKFQRFEARQGANPQTLFFTLFFNFSLDFPFESCAFSSFIIWIRHFFLPWQPERDIPGKQNLPYFDQSVAYVPY
jgi:hypothetical protein